MLKRQIKNKINLESLVIVKEIAALGTRARKAWGTSTFGEYVLPGPLFLTTQVGDAY